MGRGGVSPHRLLRRRDRQALRQAVLPDGDPPAAGRHGPLGGCQTDHRTRTDVQYEGHALGVGRRHERHARRRCVELVPLLLGGCPRGCGCTLHQRSPRDLQRAQDYGRPLGRNRPHRLHLYARVACIEVLQGRQLGLREHLSFGPLPGDHPGRFRLRCARGPRDRGCRNRGRSLADQLFGRLECRRRVDQRSRGRCPLFFDPLLCPDGRHRLQESGCRAHLVRRRKPDLFPGRLRRPRSCDPQREDHRFGILLRALRRQ